MTEWIREFGINGLVHDLTIIPYLENDAVHPDYQINGIQRMVRSTIPEQPVLPCFNDGMQGMRQNCTLTNKMAEQEMWQVINRR